MNNINELISEFIQNVKASNEPFDYSDKQAKKRHNASIDKYRSIAKKISTGTSCVCEEFLSLLQDSDEEVAIACAVCIIEIMEATSEQYNLAVKRIEEYVKTSPNKMKVLGFEMYIKKLKK